MDHRTEYWIHWTNLTIDYVDRTVVMSDCTIVRTIKCISIDCNYYFYCLINLLNKTMPFPVAT